MSAEYRYFRDEEAEWRMPESGAGHTRLIGHPDWKGSVFSLNSFIDPAGECYGLEEFHPSEGAGEATLKSVEAAKQCREKWEAGQHHHAMGDTQVDPHAPEPPDGWMFAERLQRELSAKTEELARTREALKRAEKAIYDQAHIATEKIRELGCECDSAEKTGAITLKRFDLLGILGEIAALAPSQKGGEG